jgi:hypothetical protein
MRSSSFAAGTAAGVFSFNNNAGNSIEYISYRIVLTP